MSLSILIPYRPDSPHRERIYERTSRAWAGIDGVEVVHCDDGRTGAFSLARAVNRARAKASGDALMIYSVDALPPPIDELQRLDRDVVAGLPWSVVFEGQRRFTPEQTERLLDGVEPVEVGPAAGEICLGHEAILCVQARVWDELRGMDERFIGWGPEDKAFHRVLSVIHPAGRNVPGAGLFQSLYHPDAPRVRAAYRRNLRLWDRYQSFTRPATMRAFYMAR